MFPTTFWLLLYSFLQRGTDGGVVWSFSLESYQRLASELYLGIIWRSIGLALIATVACLIIGYPLAFFIATCSGRWQNVLVLLVIIPFWTNFLVRTYAWIVLLPQEGVINVVLQNFQVVDAPLNLLFTQFAVTVGLIYGYLSFMILPLYAAMDRFNFSLVEAAQNLGANDIRSFIRIVLPLTMRGRNCSRFATGFYSGCRGVCYS